MHRPDRHPTGYARNMVLRLARLAPAAGCSCVWSAWAAAAQPPVALVVGESAYANYGAAPACIASANLLAARLGKAGFEVTLRTDLSNGELSAAIGSFSAAVQTAPDRTAVLYICALGGSLDGRDFLLPVTAQLSRPSDAITEGLAARGAFSFANGRTAPSIAAFDLIEDSKAGLAAPAGSAAAAAAAAAATVTIGEGQAPSAATQFAAALAGALAAPDADSATVLTRATHGLGQGGGVSIAGLKNASIGQALRATAAVPPPRAPASVPPGPTAMSERAPAIPDDAAMTDADRRQVQIALAKLGYYDGRLDGIFGPDSRAAIRRYQHEIGAAMTGMLTGAEATRLISGKP